MYERLLQGLGTLAQRLQIRLNRKDPTLLVLSTFLLFSVLYRSVTYWQLFSIEITPHSFVANLVSLYGLPREYLADLVFAICVVPLIWIPHRLFGSLRPSFSLKIFGWTILYLLMALLGVISGAHHDLVFEAHSGLTWDVILESLSTGSPRDIFSYGTLAGRLWMIAPVAIFAALRSLPRSFDACLARGLLIATLLILAGQLPFLGRAALGKNSAKRPAWPLRAPPALFVLEDVASNLLRREGKFERRARLLAPTEHEGMRMKSWNLHSGTAPLKRVRPLASAKRAQQPPWNIVFILMESTGAEYVFTRDHSADIPMPFLNKLAQEGVYLKDHRSNANTSPRSIFSLMSGIYGVPHSRMFCTRPDVVVPGLGSYLGDRYDKFLVTPGRLQSYFPMQFMVNSGVNELVDDLLLPDSEREADGGARHEMDAVDFFVKRIDSAREPFFGTYYPYAPHTPYSDHGAEYRITQGQTKIDLYTNNLRLLDVAIEKIYRRLESSGRLARTIIVLVGDHGEGFGQHKGSWVHGRTSYEEIYRVPAIFYQPESFAPAVVSTPTNHVDILPTLLDAIGQMPSQKNIQGDSLFSSSGAEYRYAFGNEGTLSSVSKRRIKVQVSLRKDTCLAYDLNRDPHEKNPLSCKNFNPQLDDLLAFQRFQTKAVPEYNTRLTRKE